MILLLARVAQNTCRASDIIIAGCMWARFCRCHQGPSAARSFIATFLCGALRRDSCIRAACLLVKPVRPESPENTAAVPRDLFSLAKHSMRSSLRGSNLLCVPPVGLVEVQLCFSFPRALQGNRCSRETYRGPEDDGAEPASWRLGRICSQQMVGLLQCLLQHLIVRGPDLGLTRTLLTQLSARVSEAASFRFGQTDTLCC